MDPRSFRSHYRKTCIVRLPIFYGQQFDLFRCITCNLQPLHLTYSIISTYSCQLGIPYLKFVASKIQFMTPSCITLNLPYDHPCLTALIVKAVGAHPHLCALCQNIKQNTNTTKPPLHGYLSFTATYFYRL